MFSKTKLTHTHSFLFFITLSMISSAFSQQRQMPVKEQQVRVKNIDRKALQNLAVKRAKERNATLQSARFAVEKLGKEVMKDNYNYALQTMYPNQKRRYIILEGSEEALIKKFKQRMEAIKREGVLMTNYTVGKVSEVHYVGGRVKKGVVKKQPMYPTDYTFERLVIVPVQQHFSYTNQKNPDTGKLLKAVSNTYIVAIYDEATRRWSFMKAPSKPTARLQINELRNYFRSLPLTLAKKLPRQHSHVVD